jgi:phosphatidylglycerol:prolipoprotein diacylglycerol transferase
MRPTVVEFLNQTSGINIFQWIVPYPALIYAVAMLVCLIVYVKRCKQTNINEFHALGAAVTAMICGLVGARLFFVILYHYKFPRFLNVLLSFSGGTISWGAYIGGFLGFSAYLILRKQPALIYFDVLGSLMGLGPFIGRWSCFLNGCDFGKVSSLPWAIVYPHGSIPFVEHVQQGLIDPLAPHSLPVHPLPIYLSFNGLLLFILFTRLWEKYRSIPGVIFFGYWTTYAFTRFFIEFFRGDVPVFYLGIFSIAQMMTIIIFIISLCAIYVLHRIKVAHQTGNYQTSERQAQSMPRVNTNF